MSHKYHLLPRASSQIKEIGPEKSNFVTCHHHPVSMQVGQQMARLPIVETNIVWPEKDIQKWSTKQEKKEKKPVKDDLKVEHKTGEKAK